MPELMQRTFHNPDAFTIDAATLPPAAQAVIAGNGEALAAYTGRVMTDPTLVARLGAITVPTLVLWGESDRVADPDYGKAYADAISTASFKLLPRTGHVPQLETPDQVLPLVWEFAESHAPHRPT